MNRNSVLKLFIVFAVFVLLVASGYLYFRFVYQKSAINSQNNQEASVFNTQFDVSEDIKDSVIRAESLMELCSVIPNNPVKSQEIDIDNLDPNNIQPQKDSKVMEYENMTTALKSTIESGGKVKEKYLVSNDVGDGFCSFLNVLYEDGSKATYYKNKSGEYEKY